MSSARDLRKELVEASLGLLADHGPDALQARRVAAACDTSTMSVYTYFGGMKQLLAAVSDEGVRRFAKTLQIVEPGEDPVADLAVYTFLYRHFALENPHLYRLMLGEASAHGVSVPVQFTVPQFNKEGLRPELGIVHVLADAMQRSVDSGRINGDSLSMMFQFWSAMHGYVLLELAGYLGHEDAGLRSVLLPLGASVLQGWGDSPEKVKKSQELALEIFAKLQKQKLQKQKLQRQKLQRQKLQK
ncbi:transcriptional regulator, TetR family [Segniliparus rotundus DSM 44985]|uniref:Transcriptional regulator, TetR family n=1 Tax=Segniliparus rotundus (strain ATCC BAA-972 / CDC 1076 / CIP 108378 / DSM 44985 / JCM 13578) TaxID=640132 RepID=D6Z9C5_SEGRD|nr:TetR/AcrR family transcriptional regulator [Segniliparus rotundus]ADG98555.1 transcriptional regulator, TetR family [Segniliparus rotundus DSM 44985]